jgi:hypothetical protein
VRERLKLVNGFLLDWSLWVGEGVGIVADGGDERREGFGRWEGWGWDWGWYELRRFHYFKNTVNRLSPVNEVQ